MERSLKLMMLVACLAAVSQSKPDDNSYLTYTMSEEIDSSEFGQYSGPVSTNCTCGTTNKDGGRIVGGKETQENEYPYMAAVGYLSPRGTRISQFCGCSIVTAHHCLTAAHCTYTEHKEKLAILTGAHDLRKAKPGSIYPVDRIIEHPEWDPTLFENDVALLVVNKEIEFNRYVGVVCLPNKKPQLKDSHVLVTGWGKTSGNGADSDTLLKVHLRVIDVKHCKEKHPKMGVTDKQLCTYSYKRDSCQGDSGGPVVFLDQDTNRYTQVGIVSFGKGCATRIPGINANVYSYIDWIQKTIHSTAPKPVRTCASRKF